MLALASHNGLKATAAAFDLLQQKCPALDAVVEGVSRVEDDPEELTVGYGEENLLTDKSRRMWLHWKRSRSENDDWISPSDAATDLDLKTYFEKQFIRPTGTLHVAALDHSGDLACATSTSGHAFKIAGRVGDSPIPGGETPACRCRL